MHSPVISRALADSFAHDRIAEAHAGRSGHERRARTPRRRNRLAQVFGAAVAALSVRARAADAH